MQIDKVAYRYLDHVGDQIESVYMDKMEEKEKGIL